MELTGWRAGIYRVMDWASKLAYLNLIWLSGIVIGLGVAGFFPSTVAMFSVLSKWIQGEVDDIKVFTHFKEEYRKEFLKSNLYGYTWLVVGVVIYVDLLFFRSFSTIWGLLFSFFFFLIGAVYIIALLYAVPIYVQSKQNFMQYFKNCLFIVLANPLFAVLMVLGFYFTYLLLMKIPGLLPFFGGSLIAFILMFISSKMFSTLEKNRLGRKTV